MHNDNERLKNIPPYTPMSSLGHELGVMFAFLAACFVIMGLYVFFWRAFERREAQREKARKERFTRRGVHQERSGIPEKMYDNRRVELPANSRYELPNGYENGERSTNMKMGSAGARVNRANGWVEMDVLGMPRR
ncbi:hypothetical protein BDV24DRAFT_130156 [Aspergillus arachidicola]|uniref:Uncharacterized protein n=1 Tax=Aspergillus arachidicola TaxID=656916 RepID=A0A2G7FGK1_9EURO|nr:hypothetical protein BDV24DRAFT_130156 [Aspergillus arachidicola]PIG79760.1 hypothetical protein AARAC_003336 [Aspergillus arachidicola]